jgi:hypothetical protein
MLIISSLLSLQMNRSTNRGETGLCIRLQLPSLHRALVISDALEVMVISQALALVRRDWVYGTLAKHSPGSSLLWRMFQWKQEKYLKPASKGIDVRLTTC